MKEALMASVCVDVACTRHIECNESFFVIGSEACFSSACKMSQRKAQSQRPYSHQRTPFGDDAWSIRDGRRMLSAVKGCPLPVITTIDKFE